MPRNLDVQPRMIRCAHCQRTFSSQAHGTRHRNHCPHCLWSVHLDNVPGDRSAQCGGEMMPIAVSVKPNGEWMLIHQCRQCHTLHSNRIACDDSEILLLSLALRPLTMPAFPLEQITTGGSTVK
ncbi:MAG: RNHCP domain-containing protein [Phycisphaeraceae bacterium JB051]